jgi:hypothetical protein
VFIQIVNVLHPKKESWVLYGNLYFLEMVVDDHGKTENGNQFDETLHKMNNLNCVIFV